MRTLAVHQQRVDTLDALAVMASHNVSVQRIAGDKWVSIEAGGKVRPKETMSIFIQGVDQQSINEPHVQIFNSEGTLVLERRQAAGPLTGEARIALTAPEVEDFYTVWVHAQSFPFFPKTHKIETTFRVDETAGEPTEPPSGGGFFDNLLSLMKQSQFLILLVIGLLIVWNVLKK